MQVPCQDSKKFQNFLTFCWWGEGLYTLLPVGQKFFENHSIFLENTALSFCSNQSLNSSKDVPLTTYLFKKYSEHQTAHRNTSGTFQF